MTQTTLQTQLSDAFEHFKQIAPAPVQNTIIGSINDFQSSFDPKSAIQVGDTLPEFALSNAVGETVTSQGLLAKGPVLINFYRGEWCPFCDLELAALQKHVDQFQAKGVTLVGISPELPNTSLTTVEKHALRFPVLSDLHHGFARKLGIVWDQPESLRPVFKQLGNDLSTRNGDDSFELPIPATLLVDRKGTVRNIFLDPDFTKRLEPEVALKWIDAL